LQKSLDDFVNDIFQSTFVEKQEMKLLQRQSPTTSLRYRDMVMPTYKV
jgi:hypothetical protein